MSAPQQHTRRRLLPEGALTEPELEDIRHRTRADGLVPSSPQVVLDCEALLIEVDLLRKHLAGLADPYGPEQPRISPAPDSPAAEADSPLDA